MYKVLLFITVSSAESSPGALFHIIRSEKLVDRAHFWIRVGTGIDMFSQLVSRTTRLRFWAVCLKKKVVYKVLVSLRCYTV